MPSASKALESYRKFLEAISLEKYRDELKDVKWVEQDLDQAGRARLGSVLFPQRSIFQHYWLQRDFLNFDAWFEAFWQELHSDPISADALNKFKKYHFDKDDDGWFKQGLKARMYRTWTAVLTQLDFCYMFEYLCERQGSKVKLECNAELDIRGVDARIGDINLGIVKLTQRKEARGAQRNIIIVPYPVFDLNELRRLSHSPRVSQINKLKYRAMLNAFNKYFVLLRNGFVVFGEDLVAKVVENIENPQQLGEVLERIVGELSGA